MWTAFLRDAPDAGLRPRVVRDTYVTEFVSPNIWDDKCATSARWWTIPAHVRHPAATNIPGRAIGRLIAFSTLAFSSGRWPEAEGGIRSMDSATQRTILCPKCK